MKYLWSAAVLIFLAGMPLASHADGTAELQRLIGKADSKIDSASPAAPGSASNTAETTNADDPIRLTPDRTRIIRLEQDAASVIVTNPAHAAVVMDSPRLLVVMPRAPGTTAFTVLDREGKVLLERSVIVTGAQKKYVRVRRMCADGDSSCAPSAYYYCPDGCYEVSPVESDGATNIPPIAGGTAPTPEETVNPDASPDAAEDFDGDAEDLQENVQEFIDNMPSPPVGPGMEPE